MFDRLKRRVREDEYQPDPFLHDTSRPLTEGRGEVRIEESSTRVDFLRLAGFGVAGVVLERVVKSIAEPESDA